MKKYYLFLLMSTFSLYTMAQNVGVGVVPPAVPNAKLEIVAANPAAPTNQDGLLIPRISAFPSVNPGVSQNAMMVYLTTTVGSNQPGFYFWDHTNSAWTAVGKGSFWNLTGNAGTNPATHFLGTTDNQDIIFKRNNTRSGSIGSSNISFGANALNPATTGFSNIALGIQPLFSNTSGSNNIAIGEKALYKNQNGGANIALGYRILYENISGYGNVAMGGYATLGFNTTGSYNIAILDSALTVNSSGSNNIALGQSALAYSNGSNNIALGFNAGWDNGW